MSSFCRGGLAAGVLRRKFHSSILFLVVLHAVSSIAQSVEEISASPVSLTATVSMGEFFFNPDPVTINVGDTVQWTNNGNQPHTTTGPGALWTSGLLPIGGTFSRTFNSAGTFPYICAVIGHAAAGMTGTIIVAAVADPNNTLPTAFIGSPNFYATFLSTDSIGFSGSGDDAQDGNLIGASLVWGSNIDGPIGTGESFTASLSAGSHTIILTVTDSNGASGDAIVIINVTAPTGGEGGGGDAVPTLVPTAGPTPLPAAAPTLVPTAGPTPLPTAVPTPLPTVVPSAVPTTVPTPESTTIPSGGGGGTGATVTPVPTADETPAPAPTPAPPASGATPVPASPPTPGDGGDSSALPAAGIAGIIAAVVATVSALISYDIWRRRGRFNQ